MPRLRTVSPKDPGWTRRRAGKGFIYLDHVGTRLPVENIERCKLLVIPPAWEEVWICPAPERPPPGGRHRRRRPAAVPLPRGVAPQAGQVQARPGAGGRVPVASGAAQGGESPAAGRDAVRAGAGHRLPAARSRLLPDRRRGLRRGQQQLRSGHDPQGARDHRGQEGRLRLRGQVRSGALRRGGRQAGASRGRRSAGPAAPARSCWPTRTATAGGTSPRPRSTPTSRRRSAARSRPRTSAPGTAR